jgi:hypothetical protein
MPARSAIQNIGRRTRIALVKANCSTRTTQASRRSHLASFADGHLDSFAPARSAFGLPVSFFAPSKFRSTPKASRSTSSFSIANPPPKNRGQRSCGFTTCAPTNTSPSKKIRSSGSRRLLACLQSKEPSRAKRIRANCRNAAELMAKIARLRCPLV